MPAKPRAKPAAASTTASRDNATDRSAPVSASAPPAAAAASPSATAGAPPASPALAPPASSGSPPGAPHDFAVRDGSATALVEAAEGESGNAGGKSLRFPLTLMIVGLPDLSLRSTRRLLRHAGLVGCVDRLVASPVSSSKHVDANGPDDPTHHAESGASYRKKPSAPAAAAVAAAVGSDPSCGAESTPAATLDDYFRQQNLVHRAKRSPAGDPLVFLDCYHHVDAFVVQRAINGASVKRSGGGGANQRPYPPRSLGSGFDVRHDDSPVAMEHAAFDEHHHHHHAGSPAAIQAAFPPGYSPSRGDRPSPYSVGVGGAYDSYYHVSSVDGSLRPSSAASSSAITMIESVSGATEWFVSARLVPPPQPHLKSLFFKTVHREQNSRCVRDALATVATAAERQKPVRAADTGIMLAPLPAVAEAVQQATRVWISPFATSAAAGPSQQPQQQPSQGRRTSHEPYSSAPADDRGYRHPAGPGASLHASAMPWTPEPAPEPYVELQPRGPTSGGGAHLPGPPPTEWPAGLGGDAATLPPWSAYHNGGAYSTSGVGYGVEYDFSAPLFPSVRIGGPTVVDSHRIALCQEAWRRGVIENATVGFDQRSFHHGTPPPEVASSHTVAAEITLGEPPIDGTLLVTPQKASNRTETPMDPFAPQLPAPMSARRVGTLQWSAIEEDGTPPMSNTPSKPASADKAAAAAQNGGATALRPSPDAKVAATSAALPSSSASRVPAAAAPPAAAPPVLASSVAPARAWGPKKAVAATPDATSAPAHAAAIVVTAEPKAHMREVAPRKSVAAAASR